MFYNELDFTGADVDALSLDFVNVLARMPDDDNQQDKTALLSLALDSDMTAASSD